MSALDGRVKARMHQNFSVAQFEVGLDFSKSVVSFTYSMLRRAQMC